MACVYDDALRAGHYDPTWAVEDALGVAHTTAMKYLRIARQRGLLHRDKHRAGGPQIDRAREVLWAADEERIES